MPSTSAGIEPETSSSSAHEEALLSLLRTADALQRAFHQRLKPHGVTATQYNVLRILRAAPAKGRTCSAIGRGMITSEPDITRLVSRLKAQKLLTQERDAQDRRVVWTRIAPEGLRLLKDLDRCVANAPRELLQRLSAQELKELKRLLEKARSAPSCPAESAIARPHSRQSPLLPHRPE